MATDSEEIAWLSQRVADLEEIVVRLAKATAAWDGGSSEGGVAYASALWREKVLDAVADIKEGDET